MVGGVEEGPWRGALLRPQQFGISYLSFPVDHDFCLETKPCLRSSNNKWFSRFIIWLEDEKGAGRGVFIYIQPNVWDNLYNKW